MGMTSNNALLAALSLAVYVLILVRDLDGDGRIGSGAELFGDHTRLKDGSFAADGFAALADLDDNADKRDVLRPDEPANELAWRLAA